MEVTQALDFIEVGFTLVFPGKERMRFLRYSDRTLPMPGASVSRQFVGSGEVGVA